MMWRYMAGRRVVDHGPVYDVREYYEADGLTGATEAGMQPMGETRAELVRDLQHMLADLEDGTVWDDETGMVVQE